MDPVVLLDAAGRRRSAATMPGHRRGQAPRNKGMRYPADPPSVEEIVLVKRHAGDRPRGLRLRGLIVVMWRAGLPVSEALALTQSDLDQARGAILARHGKANTRREVGMDQEGSELLGPWLAYRVQIPVGALFYVIDGRTRGRPLTTTSVRQQPRRTAAKAGVRRRFAPHQLRHAHAAEMAREGVPLNVIQRQLRHTNLAITSVNLQATDNAEIIDTVHARRAPMIPANAGLSQPRQTTTTGSAEPAPSEASPHTAPLVCARGGAVG
jgi:site-specific recombinase XerD